jgi:hypothetical protein
MQNPQALQFTKGRLSSGSSRCPAPTAIGPGHLASVTAPQGSPARTSYRLHAPEASSPPMALENESCSSHPAKDSQGDRPPGFRESPSPCIGPPSFWLCRARQPARDRRRAAFSRTTSVTLGGSAPSPQPYRRKFSCPGKAAGKHHYVAPFLPHPTTSLPISRAGDCVLMGGVTRRKQRVRK